MTNNYDASKIKILKNLEAVRKRPAMYIGSTDDKGIHHLVWEILDNAIDEFLSGFGEKIVITINKDESITIEDNGRGIPTGKHNNGQNIPELIFTTLHAGGKFDDKSYKISGGLHGVGASVVNALSSHLNVIISRNQKTWSIDFKNGGKKVSKLKIINLGQKNTGTKITFLPDPHIFGDNVFNFDIISNHIRKNAFLNPKLKIKLIDKRDDKKVDYQYKNGISDFLNYINSKKNVLTDPIFFKDKNLNLNVRFEIIFQYIKSEGNNIISFANNIETIDGGTHLTGFKSGLISALNKYAIEQIPVKFKTKKIDLNEVKEGLVAIINVKIPESIIEYEGQTKTKLGTPIISNIIDETIETNFYFWLQEHQEEAKQILDKIINRRIIKEALRKTKEKLIANKKTKKEIITKLSPARSKNPDIKELFLVEGESAGGSAKTCRDSYYQAILSLKGKIINSEKTNFNKLMENNEIQNIIHVIGAKYGDSFEIKKINYKKIIIMTDADTDGAHIQLLLFTFFYHYMKDLVLQGKIYLAQPPLYRINFNDKTHCYLWSEKEFKQLLKKEKNKIKSIQRYKGLGEMNPSQLWQTTMNPDTRKLIQINVDNIVKTEEQLQLFMGKDAAPRKEWIKNNIIF